VASILVLAIVRNEGASGGSHRGEHPGDLGASGDGHAGREVGDVTRDRAERAGSHALDALEVAGDGTGVGVGDAAVLTGELTIGSYIHGVSWQSSKAGEERSPEG